MGHSQLMLILSSGVNLQKKWYYYSLLSRWLRWCSNTTMLHGTALAAEVVSYDFELLDSRDALS